VSICLFLDNINNEFRKYKTIITKVQIYVRVMAVLFKQNSSAAVGLNT